MYEITDTLPAKFTVDGLKYAVEPDGGFAMLSVTDEVEVVDGVRVTVICGTDWPAETL
jgi:hypothetical protein